MSPTSDEPQTYTARWVFPASGPPLPNGTVTVRGTTVEAVGPAGARAGVAAPRGAWRTRGPLRGARTSGRVHAPGAAAARAPGECPGPPHRPHPACPGGHHVWQLRRRPGCGGPGRPGGLRPLGGWPAAAVPPGRQTVGRPGRNTPPGPHSTPGPPGRGPPRCRRAYRIPSVAEPASVRPPGAGPWRGSVSQSCAEGQTNWAAQSPTRRRGGIGPPRRRVVRGGKFVTCRHRASYKLAATVLSAGSTAAARPSG